MASHAVLVPHHDLQPKIFYRTSPPIFQLANAGADMLVAPDAHAIVRLAIKVGYHAPHWYSFKSPTQYLA